ncbi:hypothetical protein ACFY3B_19315 [Micromonospora parva]|uniref:Toprim domain-containing protein n=1 Tax=Micromonospora parva TaxID=1464048 RepID=A0ABW6VYY3_9ACTN
MRPLRPSDPSQPTPLGWLLDLLDHAGSRPVGGRLRQCPAHVDGSPSLALSQGEDGRALVYCHAGCETPSVLAALKVPMARLFSPASRPAADYARMVGLRLDFPPVSTVTGRGRGSPGARGYRLVAAHDYGQHVLYRWRNAAGKKDLIWETRTPNGDIPGLRGTPLTALPLYREREVKMAVAADEPVLVVESESSVDALRGFYATTWAGGAANPNLPRLARVLSGARVVVIPDNDDPGLLCAARLVEALPGAVVVLPEPDQDAADLYRAVGPRGLAELIRIAQSKATPSLTDVIAPMVPQPRPAEDDPYLDRLDEIPDEPADPDDGCCGEFGGVGGPIGSGCKLCPASPNYWKTTGERVACPDYRSGERTAFCPVCGYGWNTDDHFLNCEVPR